MGGTGWKDLPWEGSPIREAAEIEGRFMNLMDALADTTSPLDLDAPGRRNDDADEADAFERRLVSAREIWGTTPREFEVLRPLAMGDSNKEIARRLGCHEGSVERHVTALLRKARCDSRARLVARFWSGRY
jgi:DNA-binding NarL/FixJ family response regulator